MGYISGLTYQIIPYDWRVNDKNDPVLKNFVTVLKTLNTLTGKKSVMIGQSQGNLRGTQALWGMPQAQKDKLVSPYIQLAPPLLGSIECVRYLLCGTERFELPFKMGIDM